MAPPLTGVDALPKKVLLLRSPFPVNGNGVNRLHPLRVRVNWDKWSRNYGLESKLASLSRRSLMRFLIASLAGR